MSTSLRHGGDLGAAADAFGVPPDGWLDLSTGINPIPYPIGELPTAVWQRLPIHADETRLSDAARAYYGPPENTALVAAPGTQAIIQLLPRLRAAGTVAIVSPTYGEHGHRWRAAGHTVTEVKDPELANADVIVIVNPNNPDGRATTPAALLTLARRQAARGGWLVVDEAFGDVAPKLSIVPASGEPGLIVMRSFGKFFGLAGLRLGFALGDSAIIAALADALGPWAVPGPALLLGARALLDQSWQIETRDRLADDAAKLDAMLATAGLTLVGGTTLFRLFESASAPALYEHLGRAGILVRIFDRNPAWLRFGLPGSSADWARLDRALNTFPLT